MTHQKESTVRGKTEVAEEEKTSDSSVCMKQIILGKKTLAAYWYTYLGQLMQSKLDDENPN